MITHPFVSGGGLKEDIWEITVNTEAKTSGAKTTGIPIYLYNRPGIKITVDWGDNTSSILTKESYTGKDYTPSIHEYDKPGIYTVQMRSTKWNNIYIDTLNYAPTGDLTHLQFFRATLIGTGQLPNIAGVSYRISSTSTASLYSKSFAALFSCCSHLSSITVDLFSKNTRVTSFLLCFNKCSSLTSIPAGLFDNNTAVTSFSYCFNSCSGLTSIPAGLFDNNTAASDFSCCFAGCSGITSIPAGLFDNNTMAKTFSHCFEGCSGITSIPNGLFDNNPKVTNFSSCFYGCSNLTSIPAGLFDNNPDVISFNCCFWRCRKLQGIPSGLFHNNSKVTNFHMTFFGCNLSDIPIELFINCPAVTDMSGTFGDNPISSVPSGLFSSQTLVTTLGNNTNTSNGIFSAGSRGVIDIDENLFAHMLNLTQARFAFQGHYGFSIRFRATELTDVTSFCNKDTEHPVTVYVPAGSATAEAFHAIANANGIVVVEE